MCFFGFVFLECSFFSFLFFVQDHVMIKFEYHLLYQFAYNFFQLNLNLNLI
jgi:hypothetical protein